MWWSPYVYCGFEVIQGWVRYVPVPYPTCGSANTKSFLVFFTFYLVFSSGNTCIINTQFIYQCCESGSGIRCLFYPWIRDPGSLSHIFESLVTNFWVKRSIILYKLAQIFFLYPFKNKIIFNLVILGERLQKKVGQQFFLPFSFIAVVGSRRTYVKSK